MNGLKLLTPPVGPAVTLQAAKAYLGIEDNLFDGSLVLPLIQRATRHVEEQTGLQLMPATWTQTLDRFPCNGTPIELFKRPVIEVSEIRYWDSEGEQVEWDAEDWITDRNSHPARITPVTGGTYPCTQSRIAAVEIDFIAGFPSLESIHESATEAICLLVGHWFYKRDASPESGGMGGIGGRFQSLLFDLKGAC